MSLRRNIRSKINKKLIYKASGLLIFSVFGLLYYLDSSVKPISASLTLMPHDEAIVSFGKQVYAQNCASCHGTQLEGYVNWRQRDLNGYLAATTAWQNRTYIASPWQVSLWCYQIWNREDDWKKNIQQYASLWRSIDRWRITIGSFLYKKYVANAYSASTWSKKYKC